LHHTPFVRRVRIYTKSGLQKSQDPTTNISSAMGNLTVGSWSNSRYQRIPILSPHLRTLKRGVLWNLNQRTGSLCPEGEVATRKIDKLLHSKNRFCTIHLRKRDPPESSECIENSVACEAHREYLLCLVHDLLTFTLLQASKPQSWGTKTLSTLRSSPSKLSATRVSERLILDIFHQG
jgi:hypothetical protein